MPGLGSDAPWFLEVPKQRRGWLCDFLPKEVRNIGVLLYGYDTMLQDSTSKQSITNLGVAFLEQIISFRANDGVSGIP